MKPIEEVKKEIREAVEAATPGPWIYINENFGGEVITEDTKLNVHNCENWICQFWFKDEEPMVNHKKNAHLIANAPTWLISLLDHIKELEEKLTDRETRLKAGEQSYINSQAKCEILQRGLDDANKKLARLEERHENAPLR